MSRLAALVIAIAAVLGGPALPVRADEGWVIQRFAADVAVQPDASMRVVEAIDVDFGTLRRHGIFRTIPVRYSWDDTHVRVYRLSVRSVTDGTGAAVKYETSDEGRNVMIRIGDPNLEVTGAQQYRITYDVVGALNGFDDHDELFWNVNGGDWDVPTRSVTATVRVPGAIDRAACFQGASGSTEPCRFEVTGGRATFASTRNLTSRQQMTIVTSMPKGVVDSPSPIIERDVDNPLAYFESQPLTLAIAVFVLIAGLAFLFWVWLTAGRDRRERHTIVPEYEPPDSLKPAQVGLLLDESADKKDVTATIVDLAVRGHLVIAEEPTTGLFAKKDWTLTMTDRSTTGLQPYEKTIFDGLFTGRRSVKVSDLREHFVTSLNRAQDQLYRDSSERRWFATRPDRVRQSYAGVGIVTVLLGVGLAWLLGRLAGAGFVGVALSGVGLALVPLARAMPAKTGTGAELFRRSLGFRRYMEVAETERQRFAERENIFSAYLPYAIVFGCVERWARAFRDIDTAAQTAAWYSGTSTFNAMNLSSSLQGFSSNLGSAIAATPGSSGGSGFSGGGGAGGGGGGGGGGSW